MQVIGAVLIRLTVIASIDIVLNLRTTNRIHTVRLDRRNLINREVSGVQTWLIVS